MFQIRRANLERDHGCESVWLLATLIHTVASARVVALGFSGTEPFERFRPLWEGSH